MKTVYPIGTTLYNPTACSGGYNLIGASREVTLINMNGEVVHRWLVDPQGKKGFMHRVRLLPSGRLMVLFGGGERVNHVAEFDWQGCETWAYAHDTAMHHDFWPAEDGSVFLIAVRHLPEEYLAKITDPQRRKVAVFGDELFQVNRQGEIVWRWVQHEHMDVNWFNPLPANVNWNAGPDANTITDWTHTNTIQVLPENKWYDAGDTRFKPGNVLQSLRQLDTISIVDYQTHEVVWSYTGNYNGGMSGQHEPHMIAKGIPGEGNITVFDNGASPRHDLAHCGCSYVLEINPSDNSLVWVYDDSHRLFARFTANCQRLPNGNTMILESMCRRLFEVTPDKQTVWEHILTVPAQRVYRYPYDYCEQFKSLGDPNERSVTPPSALRIEPDRGDCCV